MPDENTDETSIVLAEWNRRLSESLEVPPADVEIVLDLAALAAHEIIRPAAPLSAYLIGYATAVKVSNGARQEDALAEAVDLLRALASSEPDR